MLFVRDFFGTTGQPGHNAYFLHSTARTRGSVTPNPVSQSVSHANVPAYHGSSSKEPLLVSVARQVLLIDDLTKIIYCLGNSFQDKVEPT